MPPSDPEPAPGFASTGRTVFLSKPAGDMVQAYDTLSRELAGRGYRVVPDPATELPTCGSEALELIDKALAEAEMSVHLLGRKGGFAPEGEEPIVRLQLTRAAHRAGSAVSGSDQDLRRFHRIIWAPRTLPGHGLAERRPDEVLTGFGRRLDSDQIVGDTLVDLRQFVIQHLDANAPRPSRIDLTTPGEGACVYIRHLETDSAYAEDLAERLQKAGVSALLPAFDGEEADRKMLHQRYLADCDAVVLCWANASEVWVRSNPNELKWDKLGRKAPFHCRGVVAGPPPQQPKNRFRRIPPRTDIDLVIDATDVTSPPLDVLQPLLQRVTGHDV